MDKPKITWKVRIEIMLVIARLVILYVLPYFIIASYFVDSDYPSGKTLIVSTVYIIIMMYIEERFDNRSKK